MSVLVEQIVLVCLSSDLAPSVQYTYPNDCELITPRIPEFCFCELNANSDPARLFCSNSYAFVLTKMSGERYFAFCKRVWELGDDLPACICVVTQLPWHTAFDEILKAAEEAYLDQGVEGLQPLYETLNTPLPYLPPLGKSLKLKHPGLEQVSRPNFLPEDSPMGRPNFKYLVEALSPEHILLLFSAICSESRILMYSEDITLLSHCVFGSVSLLHPFCWQHILVPLLPPSMLSYCSAPMPFIIGFHTSHLNEVMQLPLEEILFIDLDKNNVYFSQTKTFAALPEHDAEELKKALVAANVPYYNEHQVYDIAGSAFSAFFVNTLKSFLWFFRTNEEGKFCFDRELMSKVQRDPGLRKFLNTFTQTQLFTQFIEERKGKVEANKPLPPTVIDDAALYEYQTGEQPNFEADYSNQSKIESYMFTFSKKIKGKIDGIGRKFSENPGMIYSPEADSRNVPVTGGPVPTASQPKTAERFLDVEVDGESIEFTRRDATTYGDNDNGASKSPRSPRSQKGQRSPRSNYKHSKHPSQARLNYTEDESDTPQNPFAVVQPRAKVVASDFFNENGHHDDTDSIPFPLSSQAQAQTQLPQVHMPQGQGLVRTRRPSTTQTIQQQQIQQRHPVQLPTPTLPQPTPTNFSTPTNYSTPTFSPVTQHQTQQTTPNQTQPQVPTFSPVQKPSQTMLIPTSTSNPKIFSTPTAATPSNTSPTPTSQPLLTPTVFQPSTPTQPPQTQQQTPMFFRPNVFHPQPTQTQQQTPLTQSTTQASNPFVAKTAQQIPAKINFDTQLTDLFSPLSPSPSPSVNHPSSTPLFSPSPTRGNFQPTFAPPPTQASTRPPYFSPSPSFSPAPSPTFTPTFSPSPTPTFSPSFSPVHSQPHSPYLSPSHSPSFSPYTQPQQPHPFTTNNYNPNTNTNTNNLL